MSVEMWNCHSSPLDVSNNLSGYCISNLVLVSAFGICMCIYVLVFPDIFLLVDCFNWALIGHIEKSRVHSVLWQFQMGEGDISFPYIFLLVDHFKWALIGDIGQWRVDSVLWQFSMGGGDISFPYIFLLVDHFKWALIGDIGQWRVDSVLWQFWMGGGGYFLSLYILISWPFRMGSHWWHRTAKSWLSALAVLNGGRGNISLYIPISWPFQMGSHWQHWTAKSWLNALAVLNGGGGIIISFTWVNLKIWACFKFCSCFTELFHFYK